MSKKHKYKKKMFPQGLPKEENRTPKQEGEFEKNCLKCNALYRDFDPDPYWCEVCNAERKAIAREIDKKVGSTVGQRPNSGFQSLDANGKEMADGAKAWYFSSKPPQYKKNE